MSIRRYYKPIIIFGLLALIIMLPLLKPGFVFMLDMAPTPHWRIPSFVTSSYVFYLVMYGLNVVIPGDMLQKLLFLAIFFLAGFGMYGLYTAHSTEERWQEWAAYFAGFLYVMNPYVYGRFMAGQFAVLLGYALLPWFIRKLYYFLYNPTRKNALLLGVSLAGIGIVSIHTLGLAVLFGLIVTISIIRPQRFWLTARHSLITIGIFAAISSYWVVPLLLGKNITAAAIRGFQDGDMQAFAATGGSVVGRIANGIRLQGFWAENQGIFRLPQDTVHGWGLLVLCIWLLVIIGAVHLWRAGKQRIVIGFSLCAAVTLVLAAGIGTQWFNSVIPLFAGYREPHKFIGVIAVVYAFFGAAGLGVILRRAEKFLADSTPALGLILFLLPFGFAPALAWGGGGQLAARSYPADWFVVNRLLNADPQPFRVLFLPWHLYMHVSFAGGIIVNPADKFFDKPTLINNQPEFAGSTTNTPDRTKDAISRILIRAPARADLAARLAPFCMKYVILANESDADSYKYISRQSGLERIYKTDTMELYRNIRYEQGCHYAVG